MGEEALTIQSAQEVEQLRQELLEERRKLTAAYKMVALGRLVASIVHEVNTPIGSILSNNEVILKSLDTLYRLIEKASAEKTPPPPKVMAILETMKSLAGIDKIACERISSVVRGLKTFARVDEGALRKVDIHDMIRDTLKLGACQLRRRITVETDFGELPEVECYPQLLNQVLLNLLMNAGQAIEGEGRIVLRTRAENGWAHIAVADTGGGIKPEHRARIFQPGFTTKPIGEGTGLGLAITHDIIVSTHRGSIDFESEPGKGTTFHIRIPIEQSRPTAAQEEP